MQLQLQNRIFGQESMTADVNDPLEFLKLSAAAQRTDLLAYEARRATLTGLPDVLADEAAANGFAAAEQDTSPLTLVCVVCGAKFTADQQLIDSYAADDDDDDEGEDVVDGPARFRHRLGCQFRRLHNLCLSGPNRKASTSSTVTQRLTDHLRREMTTSKAKVAREFSFEEDAICTAMGVRYLTTGESYPDAGSLVDDLMDLIVERSGAEPLSVISGLAGLVTGSQSTLSEDKKESPTPKILGDITSNGAQANGTSNDDRPPSNEKAVDRQSLLQETIALYASTVCRCCRKQKVSYLVLPCRHLSLCPDCAIDATECPACGQPVSDFVRTFGL